MSKVRQLPSLYLRGSLANITMANLSTEEQTNVSKIVDYVAAHPLMQSHRSKVLRKLGVTIAADYADDRDSAEQEYKIAVWRGVVNICYHRTYEFKCRACGSDNYLTKRSKTKAIDRIQTPCPNCENVEIDDPGCVTTLKAGQFITYKDFQDSYKHMPDGMQAPTIKSTIASIPGELRYANAAEIINDDRQLQKFFGEFVWNYFRQQIKENKRESHRIEQKIIAPADYIITQDIISLCIRTDTSFNYCTKTEPTDGKYHIQLFGLTTPPEFTAELAIIRQQASFYGITMSNTNTEITVDTKTDAVCLETKILRPEHISVVDSFAPTDENDGDNPVSQISYRSIGGKRMNLDDHVDLCDTNDAYTRVKQTIPSGHCREIFDILSQQGETYAAFAEKYGPGNAKTNHIAEFLDITTRAVNQYKDQIEVCCLANDFVPSAK